ncbi:MAG: ABC transporter substrate-binding protein [bacterium]
MIFKRPSHKFQITLLGLAAARSFVSWVCRKVGIVFVFFLFSLVHPPPLSAQIPSTYQSHYVIAGKLSGREDYRHLTINTSSGIVLVENHSATVPFEILESNEQRVRLIFTKLHPGASPSNSSVVADFPIGVEIRFYTTERSLVSAFLLEEVDYAELDNEASAMEIEKAKKNYRILPTRPEPNLVEMICYNFAHPFLREKALRQALSYAVNKEKIKKQFLLDKADVARGPFEKSSRLAASGMREFGYSPRTSITLLEKAGWREIDYDRVRLRNGQPMRFRLFFPQGLRLSEQLVRQIKIDWNQIGIDVVPVPLSAAALNDSLRRGRFDAVLLRHQFEESLEELTGFFGDGAGRGMFSYTNARYHHIVKFSRSFNSPEEIRMQIMNLQLLMNEDQAATFLFHPWLTFHVMNAAKFTNFIGAEGLPKPFEEWVIRHRP